MKNKGTVKFFAIALAVVSLFHLSFTLKTYLIERHAKEVANGDVGIEKAYLDSIAYKDVYNVLVKKYTYSDCKEREINLGLDLQGGMHVTLEVAIDELLMELSNNSTDKTFREALKIAKANMAQGQKDFISYFEEAFFQVNPNGNIALPFATLENKDEVDISSSRQEVISFLRKQAKSALGSTFDVLTKRIDKFGVAQPNIQLLENTGRILIELPGVDDPERIRRYLQGAAKLEFWETYESKEIIPLLEDVNKVIKEKQSLNDESAVDTVNVTEDFPGLAEATTELNEEPADSAVASNETSSLLDELSDSLESDSAQSQLTADEWNKEYPLYKVLQPNIRYDQGNAYYAQPTYPVIGLAAYYDTAKVNEYLRMPEVLAVLPQDLKLSWTAKPIDEQKIYYQLIALKVTTLSKEAPLDGKVITNAKVDISQFGEREVSLRMNAEGAQIWRQLTGKNIGKSIAIVLDGLVYSFPTVQGEIPNGMSNITGGFESTEAQDLANVLNSGKLDVKVRIIEEAIVGPSLGKESINRGLLSLLIGLIIVLIFMVFYYHRSGYVSDLALFANLFFIIGVLASLQAALTLPGIAGIVLTIGMSVDANVLIFERIREELSLGKGLKMAIKEGYQKAYSSIIDANITTLLVGIILYTFGSGPIHGFATILIIGILTSLFSAILITRVIFDTQLTKERDIRFSTKWTQNVLKDTNFDFVKARFKAYIFSGTVIVIGVVSLVTQGLDYGVDFKGGYSYQVKFDDPVNTMDITNVLTEPLNGQPEVKIFGPKNQVKITTSYMIDDPDQEVSQKIQQILMDNLSDLGYGTPKILSATKVGATIADDIKVSAIWSVIFSLLVIFIYIFIRFRKWEYGVAAVLTPFHDVLFILAIFSLFKSIMPFSLEIDQAFIAALLTVIGYSINDTVVVFDRIREKLNMSKSKPFVGTVNTALNETLSRTLITSLTTLFVVVILFVFGGEIIRGFAFALLIGIIVGTYSSLFVSTPIVVELMKKKFAKNQDK